MQERLKALLNKVVELWNKYTKKQKAIILSTIGVVVIMIVLLVYFLGRTTYVRWQVYDDLVKVQAVDEALTQAGIAHKIGDDSATIYVDSKKTVQANIAVINSPAMSDGRMSWSDMLDNDMSTTNADKIQKNAVYFQGSLEQQIEGLLGVESAKVSYIPIDRTATILDEEKDIQCSVSLRINSEFKNSAAEGIATYVANALGNRSLDTVKVIDQYGNLLYNGPEDEDTASLSKQMAMQKEVSDFYREQMIAYGLQLGYDYAEVVPHLEINYDQVEIYQQQYFPAEGSEQGLYSSFKQIQSENSGQGGDVPGTDSNDENDYMLQTGGTGRSSYDETQAEYLVDNTITKTIKESGIVDKTASSMSIVLKRLRTYTKDDLERLGQLEGTTWEDYIVNNRELKTLTLDPAILTAFSNATGIPESNLSILLYEIPEYLEEVEEGFNWNLLLTIVLFIIIIALLVFVVFRVSKPAEVVETEPELSVEKLLATTKENQSLEDIEFSEKSETKRLIEKFVDENPDAVAQLLRNWLSDDWG